MIDEKHSFFEFFHGINLDSDFISHSGKRIKESFKSFQITGARGDK